MSEQIGRSLIEHFADVEDPRDQRYIWHDLTEMIVIAICAAISGADNWVAVEAFGQAKKEWLKNRLKLKLRNGIPSHDTFGTVFGLIKAKSFQACFVNWVKSVAQISQGEIVAVDGKVSRGSYDKGIGKKALTMVSAWANESHLVLGQVKVDDKSNEITAIPQLLEMLTVAGCIVTIDAIGTQTEIAKQIVEKKAEYVLALKENQGKLYQETCDLFEAGLKTDFKHIPMQFHQTCEKGHGRIEQRSCWTINHPDFIAYLNPNQKWRNLRSVAMIEYKRSCHGKTSLEYRFYISSLAGDPQQFLSAIRQHWGIENKLHWVLDVAFGEDHSRIRSGFAAENMALLRHIALNLLKQESSDTRGIQTKRLRAAWDNSYLEKILAFS